MKPDLIERIKTERMSENGGLHPLDAEIIEALSPTMPINIKADPDGQVWITFDADEGRHAMLNLNNIVLAKDKQGINRGIMLDAIASCKVVMDRIIKQLDHVLLRRQRDNLIDVIDLVSVTASDPIDPVLQEGLDGILNLLDSLLDIEAITCATLGEGRMNDET